MLAWVVTLIWLLLIAVNDLARRRIPNLLSLGAAAVALAILVVGDASVLGGSSESALLAAGIAMVLTLPAYIGNVLGAGDVKLATAMGLLSDTAMLGAGLVIGALLAGLWALLWLATRRSAFLSARLYASERWRITAGPAVSGRPVPFGAALCAGFAISLLLRGLPQGV